MNKPTTLEELEKKLLADLDYQIKGGIGAEFEKDHLRAFFLGALSHYRAGIARLAEEMKSPETPNNFSEGWNAALDTFADKLIEEPQ